MKGRKKFRLQNEKGSPGTLLYWVLAVGLASGLAWLIWRSDFIPGQNPLAPQPIQQTNAAPIPKGTIEGSAIKPVPGPLSQSSNQPPFKPPLPLSPKVAELDSQGRRPASNAFEAQLALDRIGFSPGSIDGVLGPQSRAALRAFQRKSHIPQTGDLDSLTAQSLLLSEPSTRSYVVTQADVGRLRKTGASWTEKSRQDRLDYETILEMVSELGHARPDFVRQLNPGVDLSSAGPSWVVRIPNVDPVPTTLKAASIRIRLGEKTLEVFDSGSVLMAHFPCSIARLVEKRPIGRLKVISKVGNPNYKFNPALFPESPESQRGQGPFIIPAGPNNPVGVGWIGLDRSGYGIHGTAKPETIGRTESRGCFRLSNWNVERLLPMVWAGMPVTVEP